MIVTVYKSEFLGKESIKGRLSELSADIKEIHDALAFRPRPGVLMEFLAVLRENRINYGTHFNSTEQSDLPPGGNEIE
jgi:hypothetical protein